jgi:hypothetical protein
MFNFFKNRQDMFLMELGTEKHLTMDNMIICCLDLFLAG